MSLRFIASALASPLLLAVFGCDSATTTCDANQTLTADGCITPSAPTGVRSSTVGYLTNGRKRATSLSAQAPFQVRRADDESVVFDGLTGPDVIAMDTGEVLRFVDFDEVTEPGSYFITVDDGGKSREFRIGDDVFVEPLRATMFGLYGLRCGSAVSFEWNGETFGHGECHTGDAAPGGWHDAGDYGKYTTNGSFSLAMMLVAWDHFREKLEPLEFEIPERGGDIPDFLDECRYQVEWLLGMQDAETGGVYDRLTPYCESCTAMNQPFDPMSSMPEQTTSDRRLAPISTPATADFAAVLARAARAFEPYDAELSQKARDAALAAWAYLLEHTVPEAPTNVKYTGYYLTGDVDDRLWAAAEIWETTGDEDALAAFEAASVKTGLATNWDWSDVQNLGIYTYLLSEREGRDPERVETITRQALAQGSLLADAAETHAYGRSLGSTYYWGINGVVARTVMNFTVAERLSADDDEKARFRAASSFQLDHLLGRNFYGRSFVTGVGYDPPHSPHHRPSVADGNVDPWPGLLIGGPSGQGQDGMTVPQAATSWRDEASNYTTNEVAINWNGAFVYALAAFLP
jgi:endoglucanase